jgi:glycosyltransferase involved in cell wall biosynthesis
VKAVVAAINENPRIRIFVHGAHSKKSYLAHGVRSDQVIDIVFPMSPRREIVPPRNLKNDDFVTLLMFGFISSYKGYETALNAMRLLPENVRLVIAGGRHPSAPGDLTLDAIYGFLETGQWLHKPTIPPLPKRMTRSERDSLRARVELLGHVSHAKLDEVMNSADIVLAPYTPNGPAGSSAIGLALSFGRPIIASAVPVFLDVQQRANCLRLISPYARFELAEAVRQLIGDYPERARMAAAASEFARLNNFGALAQKMIAAHQIDAKPLAAPSAQVLSHT